MSKKLMRIIALIMIVFLLPSTALAKAPSPKGNEITKAEFISIISDFFAWPHQTDYNDIWKAPLKQFNDVKTSDQYGKQIETAYEEGIIGSDSKGNFYPNSGITRQDAAVILVKAFKIAPSDTETTFNDKDSISMEALGSVNALVELGFMDGRTPKLFMPDELIKKEEVNKIFKKITTSMVAPVQALPKQTVDPYTMEERNIAPRRFIKLYTPTDGAKIYYTRGSSSEGWPTVEDPTTESKEYVLAADGHISELVGLRSGELDAPDNYLVYKAIAVKDGKVSPVQTFRWHLYRPLDGPFQYELVKEKTETSPLVYQLFRDNESVRAMAWYIEGEESGILFDALQTPTDVENLKPVVDEIATKPYIVIIGHEHGDHNAQMPNFINSGIDVYLNERGWEAVGKPGGFGAVVTTPEAQAKVKNVEEGMEFNLGGGTTFEIVALPGHANGNVALFDRQSGYLFSSDLYGCTRAGSADTVGISGLRADLLLSFVQQAYSKYTKDGTKVNALFTGHDESELSDNNLRLFEAALQQVIDNGEDGCTPSVRGSNNRTTMIGDMYKDGTNWIALELGGKMGDDRQYLSSSADLNALPYMSDPENAGLNYNSGGHVKYSVLSNIEIKGGELEGKVVQWAKDGNPFQWAGDTMTINPSLANRFNPWSYEYTIKVPEENDEITIIPTTMSTKVKSIRIDGKKVDYRSENTFKVYDGMVITIDIIASDKVTTSKYTFTIDKVAEQFVATPLSSVEPPTATDDENNQLPLTGFFKDSLSDDYADREVFWYIPETAVLRPYYHFITVPNDVDTGEFLINSGWKQIADETGECLFVFAPDETGKWGAVADEKDYIAAGRAKHAGVGSYFTTFGEFYLTGYGEGAAPLEAWAVENPNLVIAQSYVGGKSVGTDTLNAAGVVSFGWTQMTDGDKNRVDEDGKQEILKQMTERLDDILHPDLEGFEGLLTKDDMAVPTWLVNTKGNDSLTYWKKVNKATDDKADQTFTSLGGFKVSGKIFKQKGDTWSTEYAGRISKVTTVDTSQDVVSYDFSRVLRDDMTDYTRYDVTISYGNGLTYRMDYTDIQVERYNSPDKEVTGTVKGIGLDGNEVEGEITIKLFPVGETAKSDVLLYVPETAGDENIPVIVVSHGASQTANLFLDSTAWWQIAAKEGFAVILATRTTWRGASRINSDAVLETIMPWLEEDGRFDMTRIYASGQSAGGSTTFSYAQNYSDLLAAVYWHNSPGSISSAEGTKAIPAGMFIGDGNYSNRGIPLYENKEAADAAGAVIHWDTIGTDEAPAGIEKWKRYFYSANGISQDNISDIINYRGGNAWNGGTDNANGTIAEWQTNNARFRTFTWTKDFGIDAQDIPVLAYSFSLYQAHNNIQGYNEIMWDFLKHYSVEIDEFNNVTRYYSESGFVQDDKVEIFKETAPVVPSNDDIKSIQAYTDLTFYGQQLTKVEIEYNEDVDLSGVAADSYKLLDRGYSNPDFDEITIDSVNVNGNIVTLNISTDTAALENNQLIYTGDNATGSRAKNPLGLYATGPWYRDVDGVIYFGSTDTDNYKANTTGKGYQTRESLELKLYHNNENEEDSACLANEDGSYKADGLWLPTIDANYGEDGFMTFEELEINVPTTATDGEQYVRGWAYFPDSFDENREEKYPMVITITGAGTSFWRLPDGTHNFGTGLNFDGSGFRWMDNDAIVLNIHDRSTGGGDGYEYWVDDYNVIQYFIENYNADPDNITLTGNSRGTNASCTIASTYPGLIRTLILNNGSMGRNWSEEDWQAAAENGLRIWAFDGELDTDNIELYNTAIQYYKDAGWSDEWISENIRLTGFPTEWYYYWGETDHSTTKMTYWYFFDNLYYGPDAEVIDEEIVYNSELNAGDTYQLKGKLIGDEYIKEDFDYVIYGETLRDWVFKEKVAELELQNANNLNAGDIPDAEKFLQGNRLPYTGYFEQQFTTLTGDNAVVNGREVRVYIPDNARLREYFVVLALPSGQDVDDFLVTSGWNVVADTYNVGLLILLPENYSNDPSSAVWGNYDDEKAYVDYIVNKAGAARAWYSVFSTYYFACYGDGGAVLQQWAANNPMFVISQAYIGVDEGDLNPADLVGAGNRYYINEGRNTNIDSDIPQTDKTFRSVQKKELPIPTMLIGDGIDNSDIAQYWLDVNECAVDGGLWTGSNGTIFDEFLQDKTNTSAIATSFNDVQSKVLLLNDDSVNPANDYDAEEIYEFLFAYTRYDNTSSLGNALMNRVDYSYNSDGPNVFIRDYETETLKSEYLVYIPDEATDGRWGTEGAPVVYLFPGGSQPSHLFFDSTGWADVAKKHGLVIVNPCGRVQAGNNMSGEDIGLNGDGGVVARWSQAAPQEEYQMILDIMASVETEFADVINPNKVFGTGQSTGGGFITYLSYENPNLFTAFGATSPNVFSAFADTSVNPGKAPAYVIVSDQEESGSGNNARNYWRNRNGFELTDEGETIWPLDLLLDTNNDVDCIVEHSERFSNGEPTRYTKRTWFDTSDDIYSGLPMVNSLMCYGRAHNNVVSDAFMQWEDWFSMWDKDEDGNRVYDKEPGLTAVNFDQVDEPTTFDINKANKLPLTGYFEKTLFVNEASRTAKVYIPEGTPVRAYYTVIALADGMDTEEFLVESGWKALADEREEGLFILEPGDEGWGNYEEEQVYVNAAISFYSANNYFSIFGEHYFVGYGEGAPVLEAWAAANPLKVISQVYIGSQGLEGNYFDQFADMEFGGANGNYAVIQFPDGFEKITYDEALLPTWYINPGTGYSDSFEYWKKANDSEDAPVGNVELGEVYSQKSDSESWMTSHSGPISKVALLNEDNFDEIGTVDRIYDFLSYYTRYENAVAYGNQLSIRADYDELGIEIRTMVVEGELREYMVYVPENSVDIWGEKAPAVVVFPGNSQTDKVFLDATQWWQVAEEEGFVLAIVCEQNNIPRATTVSHKNSKVFYEQLRDVLLNEYNVDGTRIHSTGQSAGSNLSQSFAAAVPEYFASIASTSGAAAPTDGKITIDGVSYDVSGKFIPNYFIYGGGDSANMQGNLWDDIDNRLDSWAVYHLGVNEFELGDEEDHVVGGWMDRYKTWIWSKDIEEKEVEFLKLTQNLYRSHNCISEEMTMLWDFMRHYSVEIDEFNNVTRYYSESGFVLDDKIVIYEETEEMPEIQDISVTTVPDDFGQRLHSVAITYPADVDNNLTVNDFEIRYQTNNLTNAFDTYTADSISVSGNTVTLNFNNRRAALVNGNFYYYDSNNQMKSITVRLDLNNSYVISVVQLGNVTSDGTIISSGQYPVQASNYAHTIIEDFEYVHLTDDEAALILEDVEFANENSGADVEQFIQDLINNGSIDETEDAAMIKNIRDSVAMGSLNDVSLEGYGVNIWYHLPENYDSNEEYPLFVYLHGTGECWNEVTDINDEAINNDGVHFTMMKPATTWAVTGEENLDDVIVLCVQYLNGNNGANLPYDRDDAIRAGLFYMVKNFSVDVERIYASGTSQGAGRTSALIRDCAEWIAAAIIQNGGYSSAISNYGIDREALATMWSTDDCTDLAVQIHEYLFEFAASQDVALWFFQGENDFISRPLISLTMYKSFLNMYQEAGKSEEWLADNLRYTMFDNVVYDVIGETSFHSSIKPTYYFYAYYDDAEYEAVYANADGTEKYGDRDDPDNDALNNYDTKYGSNDPGGYSGLIDWTLSRDPIGN